MSAPPPPPGQLVDVDGAHVHVMVQGAGPVVVIESGMGGGVLEWQAVADGLSDVATVVRRDRPGLGWSDVPVEPAHTSVGAARSLERLLQQLGLAGPYVLVGHSLGGLHVRAFACRRPDDTAGVVLVDPSHEDQLDRLPSVRRANAVQLGLMRTVLLGGPLGRSLLARINRAALASECAKPLAPHVAEVLDRTMARGTQPSVLRTVVAELAALQASCAQIREFDAAGRFPTVPLRVISQGRPRRSRTLQNLQGQFQALHQQLLQLSPDSKHVLAERSGHLVPLEQPELIVEAVRDVLAR